ncbi:MAG TPA: heme exporter protein CcmB [Bacillota bacterium]|nr:heme exporter protein CcmB [Bacillota bacterium]HPU75359.1 heme exporter protein CcmB [Bacillota bacterium]
MWSSNWVREALAVLAKDIRSEYRTRYAFSAVLLFAVTALAVVSFSVSPYSLDADVQAAFLWIVLFFSAMTGLSRSFVREEEARTAMTLRLSTAPEAVYVGKLLFNIALQGAVAAVVVPLFLVLMDVAPAHPGLLASATILGTMALASSSTIIAAIVSRANAKGAIFAVLAFPVTLPGLSSAIRATTAALRGAVGSGSALVAGAAGDLRALAAYSVLMIASSLLLFDFVWDD